MLELTLKLLNALTPLFVAMVTAYGAVLVAKVSKLQRDIKTNHGSRNLGHAIDIIRTKVELIEDNQDDLIESVKKLHRTDSILKERLDDLESQDDEAQTRKKE